MVVSKTPLSLEEELSRTEELHINQMNSEFSKLVKLIKSGNKNLGPFGSMNKEETALQYLNPEHPIYAIPDHETPKEYGIIFVKHGRQIYERFDTSSVTFCGPYEECDFVVLQIPWRIVRAVTESVPRQSIALAVGSEKLSVAKTAPKEQHLGYMDSQADKFFEISVNYAFPNLCALRNYWVSQQPHFVINMKNQPGPLNLQSVDCSRLLPVPAGEMIANLSQISEGLLNPKKVISDQLPLQKGLYNYVTNYILPELKQCFEIKIITRTQSLPAASG